MNRYINVENGDSIKAVVGYNFLKKKFYVVNKSKQVYNTLVYRETAEEVLQIILALGITEVKGQTIQNGVKEVKYNYEVVEVPIITEEAISIVEALMEPYEFIEIIREAEPGIPEEVKMYYTLEDNGSYVRTVQFNDWADYPMEVDCEKGNLFIRNTNILYSLNVDADDEDRMEHIFSFYVNTLGLYPNTREYNDKNNRLNYIRGAYYLLANQYRKPHFYNQIVKESNTGKLVYTNIFNMANFNNLSPVNCNGERDPFNEEPIPQLIGNIKDINSEAGIIEYTPNDETLEKPYYQNLRINNKIQIKKSDYMENGVTYSSNGVYTIDNLDLENHLISVTEPLGADWHTPSCYKWISEFSISQTIRDGNRIVLTENVPDNIIAGDTIFVTGSTINVDGQNISCDGKYTVLYTDTKTIGVDEEIPYDISPDINNAKIHKEIFVGNIISTSDYALNLDSIEESVSPNDTLEVYSMGDNRATFTVGGAIIDNSIPVSSKTTSLSIALLNFAEPNLSMAVNTTSVKEYLEEYISLGSFAMNDFKACQEFIKTLWYVDNEVTYKYSMIPFLEDLIGENFYQVVEVEKVIRINDIASDDNPRKTTILFKGLYSDIYGNGY